MIESGGMVGTYKKTCLLPKATIFLETGAKSIASKIGQYDPESQQEYKLSVCGFERIRRSID